MSRKGGYALFCFSALCFFIMAASILAMPIELEASAQRAGKILLGGVFWGGCVLGVISQIILSQLRNTRLRTAIFRRVLHKRRIGVLSFFQNIPALIADVAFVISIFGLVISVLATDGSGYICYIFMAVLVYSFCMHCMLNGRSYYFLKNYHKILKTSYQKDLDNK